MLKDPKVKKGKVLTIGLILIGLAIVAGGTAIVKPGHIKLAKSIVKPGHRG